MTYTLGLYEKALPPSLDWEARLAAVRSTGFDALEISIDESPERLERLDRPEELIHSLGSAVRHSGVFVRTLCLSAHRKFPLGHPEAQVRQQSLDIMDRALDLAAGLGIRIIQLAGYDVYYEPGTARTVALFEENLLRCTHMAAARGVLLGFETMETPFMDTIAKAMRHVNRVQSPYLHLYPDLGNLTNAACLYGHDLGEDIRSGAGHLLAAHLKETEPGRYRDMRFGTGHVDFAFCASRLAHEGVRLFVAECWHHGESDWHHTLEQAGTLLREHLDRAMPGAPA